MIITTKDHMLLLNKFQIKKQSLMNVRLVINLWIKGVKK